MNFNLLLSRRSGITLFLSSLSASQTTLFLPHSTLSNALLIKPVVFHAQYAHASPIKNFGHKIVRSTSTLNISSGDDDDEATFDRFPKGYPNLDLLIRPSISAVRKACRIASYLQPETSNSQVSGITKTDTSPVTIGDFAAQAIVLNLLHKEFEKDQDVFIAEESSKNLNDELSKEILSVLERLGLDDIISTQKDLEESIDLGQTYKRDGDLLDSVEDMIEERRSKSLTTRTWCLDPIDGTRGFLRGKYDGGQYCVALALIENGVPVLGLLGCPNLPSDLLDENYEWSKNESGEVDMMNEKDRGCIFVAHRGGGCFQVPLYSPKGDDDDLSGAQRVQTTKSGSLPLKQSRFCIGVEKYGDPEGKVSAIATKIHGNLDDDGDILFTKRMDSQVKYGVVARGGSEFITRLPKKSYQEWIWDHAAGRIVIEEAGGKQTDTEGNLIDYGLGAKLDMNVNGILISSGGIYHDALLDAYREQEQERSASQ